MAGLYEGLDKPNEDLKYDRHGIQQAPRQVHAWPRVAQGFHHVAHEAPEETGFGICDEEGPASHVMLGNQCFGHLRIQPAYWMEIGIGRRGVLMQCKLQITLHMPHRRRLIPAA